MFLRRNRRTVNGECYEYWTLVKTVRTAQGPRQEIVATLGKTPGLKSRTRHGWEAVGDLLEGHSPAVQGKLGEDLSPRIARRWRYSKSYTTQRTQLGLKVFSTNCMCRGCT